MSVNLMPVRPFEEFVNSVGLLDEILSVQKRCALIILDAPFQA